MAHSMANRDQAMSGERFAQVCLTPAKASLPTQQPDPIHDAVLFECIEATQRKFKKSDKEMSSLLKVSQPNYARRKYNAARVQLLDLDMRRYFIHCYAKNVGLSAEAPTPQAELKSAAKTAMLTLLDLMEGA
jgi:hypothetical protein